MSKPTNFRREVKNLWKNYQRGEIGTDGIKNWFEEKGIICHVHWISEILHSRVKSRIFTRLGKAALKMGKLVAIVDIIRVYKLNNVSDFKKYFERSGEPTEYHKISFYTPALQEETTYKIIYTKEV